uniref:RING-type domain-containing protein n=2 Tax=Bursaphelenchus xylophilus TaxID=6326 RepID=A0A1I7SCY7_BURXY
MSTESVDSVGFQPPPNMAHHQGTGRLQGGGVKKVYNQPSFKEYKKKVDNRISFVIVLCLLTLTTITCIYAFGSLKVNDDLGHYVERVLGIVKKQNKHRTCVKVQSDDGWVEECTKIGSSEQFEVEPADRTHESNEDGEEEEAPGEQTERAKRQALDDLFPEGSHVPPGAEIEPEVVDHRPDVSLTTVQTPEHSTVAATDPTSTVATTTEATTTAATTVAAAETTTSTTAQTTVEAVETSSASSTAVPVVVAREETSTVSAASSSIAPVVVEHDSSEESSTFSAEEDWSFGVLNATDEDDGNFTNPTETFILPFDPRNLTEKELQEFSDDIQHQHIVLWMLAALNLIILILFAPFAYLFHQVYHDKSSFKVLYRVLLIVVLVFLLFEIYFLIEPLLRTAYNMPQQVDRVLLEGTPRPKAELADLEEAFACDFDYHPILVEFNKQDPCVPKIKNWLIPAMCVILMIVICLVPFIFLIFTYAWNACIKDAPVVKNARDTVKQNIETRKLTHEQMVDRAWAKSDSHSSRFRTYSNSSNLPL